jgi:hypothetical protein
MVYSEFTSISWIDLEGTVLGDREIREIKGIVYRVE